ncbi:MAG: glycosyltransferase [Cyanobacteria bacterium P01_E01_bin.43]
MKILFILPSYEPSWAYGGTVTATVNLCRALVAQGVSVTVWTTNCDGQGGVVDVDLGREYSLGGVTVRYFSTNFEKRKAFWSWGMVQHAKVHIRDFDIVDMSMIWQLTGPIIAHIARTRGVPYIVTPHSSLMAHAFWGVGNQKIKQTFWRLFGARMVHGATKLHYLCNGEERESRRVIDLPHYTIPNGVAVPERSNKARNRAVVRARHGIGPDSFVLLYLGRIHPKKQLHLVLEAIPLLVGAGANIKLLIVGNVEDSDYHARLKSLEAVHELQDQIIWCPPIPHGEVTSYYHAGDMLVLTSLIEGVSMAVTEAMAEGLPLLGSSGIANADDLAADGAGIIADQTPAAIARAIRKVLDDPATLTELQENVQRSMETRYNIAVVARQTLDAFTQVLAARTR